MSQGAPALLFRLARGLWYVYMLGVSVLAALFVRMRWFQPPAPGAAATSSTNDAIAIGVIGTLVVVGLWVRWATRRFESRVARSTDGTRASRGTSG
ncbi:MAG: hypothetical protein IPK26_14720 [Planctomycetes bacterium]|nr:hypothetical protein [Planctomycetota bacterium]